MKISNLLFEGMLKFVAKKLLKYVLNLFHHSLHVNLFWKGLLIFLKKLISKFSNSFFTSHWQNYHWGYLLNFF